MYRAESGSRQVLSKKVGTTLKVRVERKIGAQTLSLETGELAKQAAGSCLVQYGETVVLVAAATGPPRLGGDFFPLTCDYRERVAAAGKFPGGFLKREGRPTTKEILTARLMDRPIRPQFPEGFLDEIQIQSFVLASDRQNDGDILAMNGASAALAISPLPFQGPLGSVRLAYINGEFVVFPTHDELEESDLDLIVSGSKDAILMIEGFARELPESLMTQAIAKAHEYIREICDLQIELAQKVERRQGRLSRRRAESVPGNDPREVFRRDQAGQADRRQAGPGRGRVGPEGAGQGRVDPRRRDRRQGRSKRSSPRPGRPWLPRPFAS